MPCSVSMNGRTAVRSRDAGVFVVDAHIGCGRTTFAATVTGRPRGTCTHTGVGHHIVVRNPDTVTSSRMDFAQLREACIESMSEGVCRAYSTGSRGRCSHKSNRLYSTCRCSNSRNPRGLRACTQHLDARAAEPLSCRVLITHISPSPELALTEKPAHLASSEPRV